MSQPYSQTPDSLPDSTIAAISTATGRGAIAVVRMSGAGAHQIAARVVRPWPIEIRSARVCAVVDPENDEVIERAVVIAYDGRSYTGEPMVELSTHGGLVAPALVLAALVRAGAREAEPGEFTRRAVLAGRMDLVQAEAVGDLVDAETAAMHRVALHQVDGGMSRRIAELRSAVLDVEALLAYDIDFPEEDDGPVSRARVDNAAARVEAEIDGLLATRGAGETVRLGALVVIAGAPNAGKSSLMNALLGVERAIVTSVPGTTRDAIEAVMETDGVPIRLVDTAGLRASDDLVERLGIEVSERYLRTAQVVLACGETDAMAREAGRIVAAHTPGTVIAVRTKGDLSPEQNAAASSRATIPGETASDYVDSDAPIVVSAHTGNGLTTLLAQLSKAVRTCVGLSSSAQVPILLRARQARAVEEAAAELREFRKAWIHGALPATVAAVHLRAAAVALEGMIGAVSADDVLGRVFGSFCVGK